MKIISCMHSWKWKYTYLLMTLCVQDIILYFIISHEENVYIFTHVLGWLFIIAWNKIFFDFHVINCIYEQWLLTVFVLLLHMQWFLVCTVITAMHNDITCDEVTIRTILVISAYKWLTWKAYNPRVVGLMILSILLVSAAFSCYPQSSGFPDTRLQWMAAIYRLTGIMFKGLLNQF